MPRVEDGHRERLGQINFPIEHTRLEKKTNIAILLPGQDVQKPGMLDEIAKHHAGREVIDRADKLLKKEFGFTISDVTSKDVDPAILRNTRYTQPAVFVLSIGIHNINKYADSGEHKDGFSTLPRFLTGNSMGMVTAVMLAGALDFEGGLRLITKRGEIMYKFSDPQPTAMKATLNADEKQVRQLLGQYPDIDMCLINSNGVFVYGGPLESLEKMTEDLRKERNSKDEKVRIVDVAADRAMHSRYITPARKEFDRYIDSVHFQNPIIPIVGTLTGKSIKDVEGIKEELKYGFNHTFDNRTILNFFDEEKVPTLSEVNEKGSLSKSMERMHNAIEEHKMATTLGAIALAATGFGIYRVFTRHHRRYPNNAKK